MNNSITRWQANAFLLSLFSLAAFGGCAQSFNSSLSELVSEPAVQKDFVSQERAALSDLKVDPLAFEPLNKVTESDLGNEQDWGHVASLPAFDTAIEPAESMTSLPIEQTAPQASAPTTSPVPPPSIIRLEPMLPEEPMLPATPMVSSNNTHEHVLQPLNKTASEPLQLKALPQQVSDEQTTILLPTIELPKLDFAPVNTIVTLDESGAVISRRPANEPDALPTTAPITVPSALRDNTNNFAPSATSRRVTEHTKPSMARELTFGSQEISTENRAIESLTPFVREPQLDEFVSEQMNMLLPPFANHPDSDQLREYITQAAGTPSEVEPTSTTQNPHEQETADQLNEFVEALIESSMSPTTVEAIVPSSAEETQFVPAQSVSMEPMTWSDQITQTIEAFELEIDSAVGQRRDNLQRGLAILHALQSSLTQPIDDSASAQDLQHYWSHQLKALKSITAADVMSEDFSSAATSALTELNQAASGLRNSADLLLKSECFCRKVDGFGQYETFDDTQFGPKQQVLVYCELENFTPLQDTAFGNTNFKTKISSSFWITNEHGETVQTTDYPVVTDNARKLRRDFFMHLPIRFADLEPGSYELQVEVRDFGSGKSAQFATPMQFQIR